MSEIEKKDYERYLEQDTENWSEFFGNMSKYWKCLTADVCGDMKDFLYDYESLTKSCAGLADDPEVMDAIVAAGRARTIAIVSEKAMKAIGSCIDATAVVFGNKTDTTENVTIKIGDHIYAKKGSKTYHAIYAGNKNVIYYNKGIERNPCVKEIPFEEFSQYGKVRIIPEDEDIAAEHKAATIVQRALSKLGEDDFRNSESFVQWCRCGS